jgi:hypothetical protein
MHDSRMPRQSVGQCIPIQQIGTPHRDTRSAPVFCIPNTTHHGSNRHATPLQIAYDMPTDKTAGSGDQNLSSTAIHQRHLQPTLPSSTPSFRNQRPFQRTTDLS